MKKIVRTVVKAGQHPTEEQIREIEMASINPVVIDNDAPELTKKQYAEMAAIAKARKSKMIKPVVA